MRLRSWLIYAVVCSFFLSSLSFGEIRKVTREDIEWGDPSTTVTSVGGHVGHRIDNTYQLSAPYMDVRKYGADTSGAVDSSDDVQGIVDLAVAESGADFGKNFVIFFPPGAYLFTSTVTIPDGVHNIHFVGSGPWSTKIINNSTGAAFEVVWSSGSNHINITFENFSITSTGGSPTHGIKVNHFNHQCKIENVYMDTLPIGVHIDNSNSYVIRNSAFVDISNIGINQTGWGNNSLYEHNYFMRNTTNAMKLSGVYSAKIVNNVFEESGTSSVLSITNGRGISVDTNYFEENGDGTTAARANIFMSDVDGVVISGNYIDAIRSLDNNHILRNIYLNDTNDAFITGNRFFNAIDWDITVSGTSQQILALSNGYGTEPPKVLLGDGISRVLSKTATIDYGVLAANSCADNAVTVNYAMDNSIVTLGIPNALASVSKTIFTGFVSADNVVTVRRCNLDNVATADPASAIIRINVWQVN